MVLGRESFLSSSCSIFTRKNGNVLQHVFYPKYFFTSSDRKEKGKIENRGTKMPLYLEGNGLDDDSTSR